MTTAKLSRRSFLTGPVVGGAAFALSSSGAGVKALAEVASATSPFLLVAAGGALTSLRYAGDAYTTNYIANGQKLGEVLVQWRRPEGEWQTLDSTQLSAAQVKLQQASHGGCAAEYLAQDQQGKALQVIVRLEPHGSALRWSISLRNLSSQSIEVGDLAVPLPMHSSFDGKEKPTASVLKHSFVSGNGSFLFWMRSNSVGPYLVMTPERNTHLEFWDRTHPTKTTPQIFRAYVHSVAAGEAVKKEGGTWRQPHTSLTLAPAGSEKAEQTYGFQLAWAKDYGSVRQRLVEVGGLDMDVAPGMTVPTDLSTCLAIRSQDKIERLIAEHPEETKIVSLGEKNGRNLYRIQFSHLGENLITVEQADGRKTLLEFFACEPLETLIRKRGAFIAKHQFRDASKWYNGLLAEWNMESQVMLGPDNYDRIKSWRIYEVTCDDPGLSKPAYLASKLAEYPDQAQVEALDYYIEHFVWGGLQRTTQESYSYGIYGILDWKQNRDSPDPGPKGKLHMWRPYDYPHIIVMYWGMYRTARDYPGLKMKMTRDEYLERAHGTALALFTVPKEIINWEAYETGFYNEVVIPQLIEELDRVGWHAKAEELRIHWEKKVKYFVTGGANLFGSEYAFDSTGFESTEALVRYAYEHPHIAGVTPTALRKFMVTQMRANLFCRGVVEKAYYYYGSDYRAEGGDAFTLTYMSQMGGWAVLDHALHEAAVPDATVRLGYASYLSTWALMNTGTSQSGFGYWFPGEANDGGTGGGFEPESHGHTWLGQPHHRGPWYYSSETDLGYCGALRSASTVVADDAIFGRFCFGGELVEEKDVLQITPRDGVRRRLHLRTEEQRVDLEVIGARFARERVVIWTPKSQSFVFDLEFEATAAESGRVVIAGLPKGKYAIESVDQTLELEPEADGVLRIAVKATATPRRVSVTRKANS
ncbi:MAG: DUF5695 domain-containing protein [Acidobacteriaceae bacterium]|nr:DUF5695 domain-containing protein [Acidobacteriaceae bacterium]